MFSSAHSGLVRRSYEPQFGAPTSRGLVWIANGRVAREMPVATALSIRRDIAQNRSLVVRGLGMRGWLYQLEAHNPAHNNRDQEKANRRQALVEEEPAN